MPVRRLSAVDAQTYWMSAKIPNDTVLLYGFAGVPVDLERAIEEIAARARGCSDLTVRIDDGGPLTYPAWVHRDVDRSLFVLHDIEDRTFPACLAKVGEVTADRLNAREAAWRLHVFTDIEGVPGSAGPGTVAVLQISHALGGGGRTSAPAAIMFGRRDGVVPGIDAPHTGVFNLPISGFRAARAHRQMTEDTAAGRVPPPADLRPVLRTNARPAGPRHLRTVVRRRSDLSGADRDGRSAVGGIRSRSPTICVASARTRLSSVPKCRWRSRRLAWRTTTSGTSASVFTRSWPSRERGVRIAADLDARRRRAAHPAIRMADLAFAATPAPLLRWGMDRFDPDVRVEKVTGNAVVSSVNCGAMDFDFGGAPVTLACAFPGLSPMMGLTHAVCGVGDTISLSVHAAESAIGDIDAYVERLDAAL